ARPAALGHSVTPAPPALLPTAPASSLTAGPTLPHSTTPVATPHNPHTESLTLSTVTLLPHTTPDTAVRPPEQARPSTTHPRRCGALSPAARAPLHSAVTVVTEAAVHLLNRREDMLPLRRDVRPRAPAQRLRNSSAR